jgi:hypothetical protein
VAASSISSLMAVDSVLAFPIYGGGELRASLSQARQILGAVRNACTGAISEYL